MSKAQEVNILLRAQIKQLERDLKDAQKLVKGQGRNIQQSTKQMSDGFKEVDHNAGLAGASLMSVGGILSDMPYGIRGVANNIQQLGATFSMLVGKTGGIKGALRSLAGQVMGPMGIMVAFQGAISVLQMYMDKKAKAKKATEEAAKEEENYTSTINDQTIQLQSLGSVFEGNTSLLGTRKEALDKLKDILPELTDIEIDNADSIGLVNKAIQKNIKLIGLRSQLSGKVKDLIKAEEEFQKSLPSDTYELDRSKSIADNLKAEEEFNKQRGKAIILNGYQLGLDAKRSKLSSEIEGIQTEILKLEDKTTKAKESGKDKDLERLSLSDQTLKKVAEINNQVEKMEKVFTDVTDNVLKDAEQNIQKIEVPLIEVADTVESRWESMYAKMILGADKFATHLKDMAAMANSAFNVFSTLQDNKMKELDYEYEARKNALKQQYTEEQSQRIAIDKLDAEMFERRRAQERKEAQLNKVKALFDATINTAVAVTKNIANPILAGITAALGGAQIAAIAATPIPALAEGGLAYGPTLSLVGDNRGAQSDPEVIAPLSKLQSYMGGGVAIMDTRVRGNDLWLTQRRTGKYKSRVR